MEEKRQKGIQEQIRDWQDSLPKTEAQLVKNTAMYLARHPLPTTTFPPIKPVNPLCHKEVKDHIKYYCASKNANHYVPYYDSGDFTEECSNCTAELLPSQKKEQLDHKWGKCCAYGDVHTTIMKNEYAELTKNAPQSLKDLVLKVDKPIRENFLDNTIALNNAHSFGSLVCGKVKIHFNFQ